MAAAAVETLAPGASRRPAAWSSAPAAADPPHPRLRVVAGDHPEPGPGSLAAAEALGRGRGAGLAGATRSGCSSPAAPPA